MSNLFVANPAVLKQEGGKLISDSIEFNKNVKKLYSTVEHLVSSGYESDAARAIAQDIEKYHEDLNYMTKTIKDYGDYCNLAATEVTKNEQNIIDNIG